MDAYEATRIVFSRIQSLDPENAAKIMGLLLIQDHGEKEMIRLAFGPEALLHSVVLKARKELGLHPSSPSPSSPVPINNGGGGGPGPFYHLSRQTSSRFGGVQPPPPLSITSPSWAPSAVDVQCPSPAEDLVVSPVQSPAAACSPFYGNGGRDFAVDDFPIQDQLSFLNNDPYQDMGWGPAGPHHRRSFSAAAADLCLSPDGSGFGWKPCLYFARGFCKNGSSCRFLHGLPDDGKLDAAIEQQCQEMLLRSKSQRALGAASAFPFSPTAATMPVSPSSSKCMNYFLQHQQNENQRAAAAAAAAALMLGGDESHRFMGRSRIDRSDFAGMVNPGSRQIYLTFPADSTFREEDVSNYFSIYGPVQDVRIPYQQKRMFGFVTFVYPETVKLILAKGNPHFVCDARVLVKPYKEKGKVPDKKQQQQGERGDFSGCTTPTGLDSRDPYDLQQLGASRMLFSGGNTQEMLLRRKLEEQQQATELQQAIELQGRRFMGLQLLDFKNRSLSSPTTATTISSPTILTTAPSGDRSHEESPAEEKIPSPPASSAGGGEQQQQPKALNPAAVTDKEESAAGAREGSPNEDGDFQESVEHNLPDSPFASPTKASSLFGEDPFASAATAGVESELVAGSAQNDSNGAGEDHHLIASTLLPPTSALDMPSFKSCFLQMPRFASGHGAVGL